MPGPIKAALLLVGCLLASEATQRTAHAPAGVLSDLAWLAGCWSRDEKGSTGEECWLEPKGGIMLGVHRDVHPSGGVLFEFLRIESSQSGIVYLASPMGRPATPFRLVSTHGRRAVFENPEHDFPRRITYWLDNSGDLHARIEGTQDEKERSAEWVWQRRTWDLARPGVKK